MDLRRTNLIMEFGPYGPSGAGSNSTTVGFAAPVGSGSAATYPFMPNMDILRQKDAEAQRRRERLRQLALGWFIHGVGPTAGGTGGGPSGGASNGPSAGAGPGKIF